MTPTQKRTLRKRLEHLTVYAPPETIDLAKVVVHHDDAVILQYNRIVALEKYVMELEKRLKRLEARPSR